MLHFSKLTNGGSPISDDAGSSGVPIFDVFTFDGTLGGAGQTNQILLFVFNDDTNYKYNSPVISLSGSDAVEQKSWFTFLDDENVAGSVPTEAEWITYGISGTYSMTILNIGKQGATPPLDPPERKIWVRCAVPAGIATINLSGLKLAIASVEEAV